MIRITSRRHNFRRCGMAHPKGPTEYPDDRFTKKELKILKAEPMLTVEVIDSKEDAKEKAKTEATEAEAKGETKAKDPEKMTITELQAELALYQEFVPSGLKKAEYVEMISAHREAKGS